MLLMLALPHGREMLAKRGAGIPIAPYNGCLITNQFKLARGCERRTLEIYIDINILYLEIQFDAN